MKETGLMLAAVAIVCTWLAARTARKMLPRRKLFALDSDPRIVGAAAFTLWCVTAGVYPYVSPMNGELKGLVYNLISLFFAGFWAIAFGLLAGFSERRKWKRELTELVFVAAVLAITFIAPPYVSGT